MNPGDRVRVERGGTTNEGVVLPSSTSNHIVLKLDGGYNIGIDREAASVDVLETDVHDIGDDGEPDDEAVSKIEFGDDLPTISLISTGGTIASTVDYRTGAVTAQFTAEDVLRAVPELAGRANYRGRVVANILSENMEPAIWRELAEAVAENCIVSVPCITTTPSAPASISSWIARASSCQIEGSIFSLRMLATTRPR